MGCILCVKMSYSYVVVDVKLHTFVTSLLHGEERSSELIAKNSAHCPLLGMMRSSRLGIEEMAKKMPPLPDNGIMYSTSFTI